MKKVKLILLFFCLSLLGEAQITIDSVYFADTSNYSRNSAKLNNISSENFVTYTDNDRDLDMGANSISTDTVKIDGVPLLLNAFKQGNLGGDGNIFYSTGASSQPASGTVNQVVGNNYIQNQNNGAQNANIWVSGNATFGGNMVSSNIKQIQYVLNVPSNVNDAIEFATVTNTNFSSNVELFLSIHSTGYAQSKRYIVPVQYNGTSGVWQKLLPISSTGAYNGEDAHIDVKVSNHIATFRIRRVLKTTYSGIANITLSIGGDVSSTTVAPASTAYTNENVTVNYAPTSVVMQNGKTGINKTEPIEALDVNGNLIADTIKARADIIVTGEIYDKINHLYGMVYDSTITLSLTQNVWQQVTNATKTLYSTAEQDGITISGDTIVFSKAGGYDVSFEFNNTGIDSKQYHYRILQKNGTTTVRSYNKYASTGTQQVRNERAYVHVSAGSKVWCEIMSPSSAPGSITIQGAKVYAMQRYLEK